MANITLYDLAQRTEPNRCWSYNVWKIRMALNYKGLPFTTAWVDHDTLKPTLQSLGVPPNTSGQVFEYTVPTVKLADGSVITESSVIASKLEEIQPLPSLRLDAELQAEVVGIVHATFIPLFANYLPLAVRRLVKESNIPAFTKPREERFGMTLQELEEKKGGSQAWVAAEPGFVAMKQLLTNHKVDDGPFIHGSQVCYADFMLVAIFETFARADKDMFDKAVGRDAAFKELYDASREWLQNDQ